MLRSTLAVVLLLTLAHCDSPKPPKTAADRVKAASRPGAFDGTLTGAAANRTTP